MTSWLAFRDQCFLFFCIEIPGTNKSESGSLPDYSVCILVLITKEDLRLADPYRCKLIIDKFSDDEFYSKQGAYYQGQ